MINGQPIALSTDAMRELTSLAAVHAENERLRARIAHLESLTMLPEIGVGPDLEPDIFTAQCGHSTDREDADLCENCDDRAPLPCDAAE